MILIEKKINHRKFILIINSIVEEDVEAIVNPANEQLAHGGGVAGLISRRGGPEIQKESKKKAPVKTGYATHTTAGRLPFKAIIHTVGPIWRGGYQKEPELLRSAVLSALQLAEQLKLKSISLPSISTGIFGYPLEPAIKIIIETIIHFLKTDSSVEEVHLCEYSEEKAIEIKTIMEKYFGDF
ncbi:MAG: macro domain-containing protein [Candidatus Aminicenantes bacterium]|nr:macro domain-containing protein [Candidatus Aminicenantes bacterium]